MQDLLDRRIEALHRRRRLQRCSHALMPALGLGLGVAATLVMLIRLASPEGGWLAVPVAVAGLLLPLVVLPRTWQLRDGRSLLAGHLDRLCAGHGLAMALAAQMPDERDADWSARLRRPLEDLTLPSLSLARGRRVLFAALCLTVALCLPQAQAANNGSSASAGFFHQTEERLRELDATQVLPPAERELARQQLDQLEAHARTAGMDQPTWEGLDRLRQHLDQEGSLSAQRLAQALAVAETLARPQQIVAPSGPDSARLAQAVAELAAQAPGLVPKLPAGAGAEQLLAALAQAAAKGALSPEQVQAVQQLGLLRANGKGIQLDAAQARALAERVAKELAKARAALGDKRDEFDDELRRQRNQHPGVSDDPPGHTPLTWDDPARTPGSRPQGLPPGMQANPDGSVTIAEQVRDAEIDDESLKAAVRAAARDFDATAADARRATVTPRHRAAVERYFAAPTGDAK